MTTPVAATAVKLAPSASGTAGAADSLASTAAAGADSAVDFAALLLAQVDAQELLTAEPMIKLPAPADEALPAGDPGQNAVSASADLATLLNSIVLPGASTPPPAATAAPSTTAATAVGQLTRAIPAAIDAEPGAGSAADKLLQNIDSARQSAIPEATGTTETTTAKFADLAIKLPATPTETGTSAGNPTPAAALTNMLPTSTHYTSPHPGNAPATPTVRLDTPLGDARWSNDFSQRIVWLAGKDTQFAQLTINPPNLGPVDVSLNLGRDQATAIFSSPHAEVREALESALPRLREMLAAAGISLGQTQVNSQSQQQAGNQGQRSASDSPRGADGAILPAESVVSLMHLSRSRSGAGLVDTFA